jgi:hypothetical protein
MPTAPNRPIASSWRRAMPHQHDLPLASFLRVGFAGTSAHVKQWRSQVGGFALGQRRDQPVAGHRRPLAAIHSSSALTTSQAGRERWVP